MTVPAARPLNEAVEEIERKIAGTPVRIEPFPHLVVDDLLPSSVRRDIDRYWPGSDRLTASNYFQRGELLVSNLAHASAGPERLFWQNLRGLSVRTSRAVRARLTRHFGDKFRPLIGSNWRRKLGAPTYHDRDAMVATYDGVVDLVPHVDHARVVVNGFIYLDDPEPATPEPRRGTMLYRSIGFAWPSNMTIPKVVRDRFLREDVDVGWRDNRLLAYVNGPWSFHGVPRHDLGEARRRLLMFGSLLDEATMDRLYDPELR